ncbi:hypothetical protein P0L94_12745 [Microbacter sp. GSS18]|nr:hypothetical protein P0L94_12745 [Microbacter sp. GSS18]
MNEELLLHLAEIGGVFVGFGALIAVRSPESRDPHARGYLRAMVWMGSSTMLFALLPIILAGYGLSGRALWLTCAIVALIVYLLLVVIDNRQPDMSGEWEHAHPAYGRTFVAVGLPLHATIAGGSLLIIIGILPTLEPAIYATVVTATLVFAAWTLVMLLWDPLPPRRRRKSAEVRAQRQAPKSGASPSATGNHSMRHPRPPAGRRESEARRVRAMTGSRSAGGAR